MQNLDEEIIEPDRWVKIHVCMPPLDSAGRAMYHEKKIVLHVYDIPIWLYERRLWVIRWRNAFYQMKFPKHDIQNVTCFYDRKTGEDLLNSTYNKVKSAKAQVTKLTNKLLSYEQERAKELFWEKDRDEPYLKAVAKLQQYQEQKNGLLEKYNALLNKSNKNETNL